MSTLQVLLLSIFIALLILENYGYGYWMISRPIFAGPLIGHDHFDTSPDKKECIHFVGFVW